MYTDWQWDFRKFRMIYWQAKHEMTTGWERMRYSQVEDDLFLRPHPHHPRLRPCRPSRHRRRNRSLHHPGPPESPPICTLYSRALRHYSLHQRPNTKLWAVVAGQSYPAILNASAHKHFSDLLVKSFLLFCHNDTRDISYQHCMDCHFKENGYYYKI